MSNYKGLRRFYLIIEKLKDGKNVSFKDISNHLDKHDVVISERTLQRDIAQIRSDFSIDIVYDKAKRCYFIDESTSIDLPNFYRFLELTLTTELLKDHQKEKRNVLRYIQFEPIESLRGHENLKVLLDAILLRRWIKFTYTRFLEDKAKEHEVIPCLVKRFQNRWYLIGKTGYERVLTFGIDRISSLKRLTKVFKESEQEVPEHLNDVVGITVEGMPERVVLEADSLQANYLATLPLHSSQKVIKQTKNYTWFEYNIIPNYELVQELLKLSGRVKVIEPAHLKEEVGSILLNASKDYKRR